MLSGNHVEKFRCSYLVNESYSNINKEKCSSAGNSYTSQIMGPDWPSRYTISFVNTLTGLTVLRLGVAGG